MLWKLVFGLVTVVLIVAFVRLASESSKEELRAVVRRNTGASSAPLEEDDLSFSYAPQNTQDTSCSKGEGLCRRYLEETFQERFPNTRPSFLINPETGRRLEYDCYCPKLSLALEYNGIQHYKYPNPFHRSEEEFMAQCRRDDYKMLLSDKHNIDLIIVPYTVKHKDIPEYIASKLRALGYRYA